MVSANEAKKKTGLPVLLSVLVLILLIAGVGFYLWGGTRSTTLDEAISIEIPDGSTAKQVVTLLDDNDLIMNKISFEIYIRMNNAAGEIKPGKYTFGPGRVTYGSILSLLKVGDVASSEAKLTIPEGYTVWQIAQLLEEKNIVKAQDFLDCASAMPPPYDYIPDGSDYTKFEGFLYPETYIIGNGWDSETILTVLLAQFDKIWTDERSAKAEAMGMTAKEIVTVASLVEREVKVDSERPIVASVIYNRLSADMLLQIDATVQYALGKQKERLLYSDLEIDSPYNTYKYKGLPAGPIASPGEACIDAALNPSDTNYFYYQTSIDGDGSHYFCETYEEHQAYSALKKQN